MWRSHHSFTFRSVLYKTRTAYTVLKSNNRIFFSSFLWRLICATMKMTFCSCNDFFHSIHAILIGKEHRDWIPIYTGYPDALCSTRKNRNWCKRKGSCRRVQGCFFVCTIFDSFLNDFSTCFRERADVPGRRLANGRYHGQVSANGRKNELVVSWSQATSRL